MIFKRLIAFVIDLLIIAVITGILFLLTQSLKSQILILLFSALMITFLLCKDIVNGQSFGKIIMKLKVVDSRSNNSATNISVIVRNIFVIFWIVEVFVLFVSKDMRIGDYIAKTKVISNEKLIRVQLNKTIILTILLCFCVVCILLFVL